MAVTTPRRPGRAVAVRPAPRRRPPVRYRPVRRRQVRRVRAGRRRALLFRGRRRQGQVPGWVIVVGALVVLLVGRGVVVDNDAPAPPPVAAPAVPAAPYTDSAIGCIQPDPTSNGCLTGATRHGLEEIGRVFGGYRAGPKIKSTGCWDEHAWNPSSDHPRGKACDLFPGRAGAFAGGAELANGWELANWLRANADPLQVSYVIWQGRIWQAGRGDSGGWGSPYTGGGIYNPRDATGGHFDHVHVSFRQ